MISFRAHSILKLSFEKLILIFLVSSSPAFAQGDCDNVGFESGNTSKWVCSSGTFGETAPPKCNSELPIKLTGGNCQDQGGIDGTAEPIDYSENRHTIMSKKNVKDPNSNNTVPVVAPANMFPTGVNNYSFRLGNAVGGTTGNPGGLAFAEAIKYTFTVTKDNAGLTYMYAAFVKEQSPEIHPINMAPRFEIKITDASGKLISCGDYHVIAGQTEGFKDGATDNTGNWKYTDWTKVGLDLSGYLGATLTIEFRTTDCFPSFPSFTNNNGKLDTVCNSWTPGSHSAYAYIDLYCTPIEIVSPPVCANQSSVELCGPPGYKSYQWEPGPGLVPPLNKQCVKINNPKAGNKYTVNMISFAGNCPSKTTITLSGSDFTVKDVTLCEDSPPTKLTATPTTTGDYSWKWEPATNLSCTDCPDPIFTPGTTTTYTVTMSDKKIENCNQVKELKVSVGAGFTVTTDGRTICEGEETVLTASGADSYIWKPGDIPGQTITVKPSTTTTYTVTGTSNSATCPGNPDATATVTVNLKPIVNVTDITICKGETAKLNGSITGGTTKGTWVGGMGKFTPSRTALDAVYTPTVEEQDSSKITLTLESDDPEGPCVKDSKTMIINITPPVTSNAGPDQTICEGESATLNGVFGGAATQGRWINGTGTYTPSSNDPKAVYQPSITEIKNGKQL